MFRPRDRAEHYNRGWGRKKVNKIIGSYVQLTIIAPKSLRDHRREVWDRIKLEESDINE